MSARMLDRVGLLTPRLAIAGAHADLQAADALIDLRIGLNMAQLQQLQSQRADGGASVRPLLRQLSRLLPPAPAASGERRSGLAGMPGRYLACRLRQPADACISSSPARRGGRDYRRAARFVPGCAALSAIHHSCKGEPMIGEVSLYGLYVPSLLLLALLALVVARDARPGAGARRFLPLGLASGPVRSFAVHSSRCAVSHSLFPTGFDMTLKISFPALGRLQRHPAGRRRRIRRRLVAVAAL